MTRNISKSLKLLRQGELIIVPTDTVYGLVCRYDSKSAIERIYDLKKRSKKKPLILLGYNWKALRKFVLTTYYLSLITDAVWPGPVTLVLPISKKVPKFLNKGFNTIGVRVPNNKFLLKLLKHSPGQVLASTSANISGKGDKAPQKELLRDIKLFIKAQKSEMSLKSSRIIEFNKNKIKILR